MTNRIQELVTQIKHHSNLYYRGLAEITNHEFDAMVDELKKLDPENPLLTTTGYGYHVNEDNKVKHLVPVKGISVKVRTVEEMESLRSKYPNQEFIMTPKLDGGSVVLYYQNLELVKAISRGDGEFGVDITKTMKALSSVPKWLNPQYFDDALFKMHQNGDIIIIRGEVIIPEDNTIGVTTFRNSAVGFSQLDSADGLTPEELSQHIFIAYSVFNYTGVSSKYDMLLMLNDLKFQVPNCITNQTWDDIINFVKNQSLDLSEDDVTSKKYVDDHLKRVLIHDSDDKFMAPIDGIVIETTMVNQDVPLIALKYDTDAQVTKILNIIWQPNRTGRFTPVAEVEPRVFEDGSTVSRVTLNNYQYAAEMRCGVGAEISIIKSGGIIPKVVDVIQGADLILDSSTCPGCGKPLVKATHLECANQDCNYKTVQIYWNMFMSFEKPLGFGESVLEMFLDRMFDKFFNDQGIPHFRLDYGDRLVFGQIKYSSLLYCVFDFILADIAGNLEGNLEYLEYCKNNTTIRRDELKQEESVPPLSDAKYELMVKYLRCLHERLNNMNLATILECSNIPSVGEEAADALMKQDPKLELFSEYISSREEDLSTCKFLSLNVPTYLVKMNLEHYRSYILKVISYMTLSTKNCNWKDFVKEYVPVEKPVVDESKEKICLTNLGGSPLTKSQIAEKYPQYNFVDYVDKTVSKVVYCKPGSSKMKKAESLGIECQHVEEFLK